MNSAYTGLHRHASISDGKWVAIMTEPSELLREAVRQRYAEAAASVSAGGPGCCGPETAQLLETDERFGSALYTQLDRDTLPVAAVAASLGCGNPTAIADLHPGERVL